MFSVGCMPKSQREWGGDPLGMLPWWSRWQTHSGNKALMGNLFQDFAFNTPASIAGNSIGGVRSVLGAVGDMTQSASLSQASLLFDSECPVIDFDGASGNWFNLPDMSSLTQGELFLLWKNSSNGDGSNIMHLGTGTNSYLPFGSNGQTYDSFGTDARKDNISIGYTSGYNIYNASSKVGEWRNALNGIEQFSTSSSSVGFPSDPFFGCKNTDWPGGQLIAIFIFSAVLTTDQRKAVNDYLTSLQP